MTYEDAWAVEVPGRVMLVYHDLPPDTDPYDYDEQGDRVYEGDGTAFRIAFIPKGQADPLYEFAIPISHDSVMDTEHQRAVTALWWAQLVNKIYLTYLLRGGPLGPAGPGGPCYRVLAEVFADEPEEEGDELQLIDMGYMDDIAMLAPFSPMEGRTRRVGPYDTYEAV